MLIDKEGTIVYKGHPASRPDLEGDMTKLANGEKLTGEGIKELTPETNDGTVPEVKVEDGFTEMETAKLSGEIEQFEAICKEWQADVEMQKHAKDMLRSFCVVVL
jgi:hypothetical protein